MTISTTNNRNDYTGNGVADTFAYGFKILSSSEIKAVQSDLDGVPTDLTGFTVTGVGNASGGNIILTAPLTDGYHLTIVRDTTNSQTLDIRNTGAVFRDTIEDALDRRTMVSLQQQEEIDRSIKIPVTDPPGINLTLPSAAERALKTSAWDADGNVIAGIAPTGGIVSSAMVPVVQASTLALAREEMGVSGVPVSITDSPYNAVGDDSTDNTTAIQLCFDENLDVFIPEGIFKISGEGLQMRSGSRITGAGRNSVIKKTTDTDPYILYATSKTNVVVRDLNLDGNRSTAADYTNSKFGLYLNSCTNCRVDNVLVQKTLSDGIVVENGNGNIIIGCDVNNNNKQGIYLSGAEDCVVAGNACHANGSNSTGGGIAIACAWNCTVTGNTCYDNVQSDIIISRGSRHCVVTGNTNGGHLSGQAALGIYVLGEPMGGTLHGVDFGDGSLYYGASDCIISNNTGTKEMRLELLTDSIVSGNQQKTGGATYAIWLTGCTRVTLEGNRIDGYNTNGIVLSSTAKNSTVQTTDCVVRGNEVYQSGGVASAALSKSGTGNIYEINTLNSQPLESGGSWTPALSSNGTAPSITYTDQQGSYAVVGDLVFVRLRVTVNVVSSAGTGTLTITGFPFQSLIKEQAMLSVGRLQNMQNSVTLTSMAASVDSSTSIIYYNPTPTGASSAIQAADALKTAFSFTASGVYRIGAA
jgi:parallel beta-helix repeat protein